eukprot:1143400-Pelagomonas_calceolata.AAC.13
MRVWRAQGFGRLPGRLTTAPARLPPDWRALEASELHQPSCALLLLRRLRLVLQDAARAAASAAAPTAQVGTLHTPAREVGTGALRCGAVWRGGHGPVCIGADRWRHGARAPSQMLPVGQHTYHIIILSGMHSHCPPCSRCLLAHDARAHKRARGIEAGFLQVLGRAVGA